MVIIAVVLMATSTDWIGWVIGLLAIAVAVIIYSKSKLVGRLVYQAGGSHLIGGEEAELPDEVTISYSSNRVPRLTSSRIVIWNEGRATIKGQDIVSSDPLRVTWSSPTQILRHRVTSVTRSVNKFETEVKRGSSDELLILFDYLDSDDGAAIEVLHTGTSKIAAVRGSVRGMPRGVEDWGRVSPRMYRRAKDTGRLERLSDFLLSKRGSYWVLYVSGFTLSMVAGTLYLLCIWFPTFAGSHAILARKRSFLEFSLVGLAYLLMPSLVLWGNRRRFPRKLHVEED